MCVLQQSQRQLVAKGCYYTLFMLFCNEFTSSALSSVAALSFSSFGVSEFWLFKDSSSLGGHLHGSSLQVQSCRATHIHTYTQDDNEGKK